MKFFAVRLLLVGLWVTAAVAQGPGGGPGPGPTPSPFTVSGLIINPLAGYKLGTNPATTALAGLNVGCGTATPSAPVNGDFWCTSAGAFIRINGVTIGPLGGATSSSFAAAAPLSVSFPGGVVTYSLVPGTSVVNPGTGTPEMVLPIQAFAGASKTFGTADLFQKTRRSNSGSAMTDTFPAASTTGLVNGTRIDVANGDATATDTITAGAGTTILGNTTYAIGPQRDVWFVYDLANTEWRLDANTGSSLLASNNLSDVASASTAITNLFGGQTGTGNAVRASSPTIASPTISSPSISNPTVTGSFTATGLVTNSDLVSPTITINTVPCTLGSNCTISVAASLIINTSTITGGTPNGLLYDNAGTVGNLATANSGVLVTSAGGVPSIATTLPAGLTIPTPSISSPTFSGTVAGAGTIPNSVLANSAITLNGVSTSLGGSYNPTWFQAHPGNLTITTPTAAKFAGFNQTFVPNSTGTIFFIVHHDVSGSATATNFALYTGTGTPPTPSELVTSVSPAPTSCGFPPIPTNLGANTITVVNFCIQAGLSPGTTYWVDEALTASTGSPALNNVGLAGMEK